VTSITCTGGAPVITTLRILIGTRVDCGFLSQIAVFLSWCVPPKASIVDTEGRSNDQMSTLSSALVIPDSLLAKEAKDILREHCTDLLFNHSIPFSKSQQGSTRIFVHL
jgi:hypothetical protein